MLDLPGLRPALDFVITQTDLFMPSGPELFLFSTARTEGEAARDLLDRGVAAVVVKRGAEGAVYFDAAAEISVPAYAAEEIDPTGAGDCFGATFVSCWLRGLPPKQALAYANAAGSLMSGSHWWFAAAGYVFIVSACLAFYVASAMMFASASGRIVLPLFKGSGELNHPGERLPSPIGLSWAEPGIKHGQ